MAVNIFKKDTSGNARKRLKARARRVKKKKSLRDFYGALKDIYSDIDAVAYQKKLRDE